MTIILVIEKNAENGDHNIEPCRDLKKAEFENFSEVLRTRKWCLVRLSSSRYRVARWVVFKPKIPIWVNFGGP
jgi:hypothetical protein